MSKFIRWVPALLMMAVIFTFSSIPSTELPILPTADYLFKKGGHAFGYALLAYTYWYALDGQKNPQAAWWAWLLALLYSATDEFHQSFTPGRHPSAIDVLVFDNLGAAFSMLFITWFQKHKQKSGV